MSCSADKPRHPTRMDWADLAAAGVLANHSGRSARPAVAAALRAAYQQGVRDVLNALDEVKKSIGGGA